MSRTVSATITVGQGSERHNHDVKYRGTLKHCIGTPSDVVELTERKSYAEQINAFVKPYIDEYNARVEERYSEAWERFNQGEIKTKPRKRNYETYGYDFYNEHKDDTYYNRAEEQFERMPLFRSIILGLGDSSDRENEVITKDEAEAVFRGVVASWEKKFPDFKLLGATFHADEGFEDPSEPSEGVCMGFYHCHIDYMPLYDLEAKKGLQCGRGQEGALEHMGFEPEQSIINASDKVPIRFNAFRNALYYEVEEHLQSLGIGLEYGVSKTKDPAKDSSKNQRLDHWRETQARAKELQHNKNIMLDVVRGDNVSPEGYAQILEVAKSIENSLSEIERSPKKRFDKTKAVVEFRLLDQLKSFLKTLTETVAHLLHKVDVLSENLDRECAESDRLSEEIQKLQPFERKYNSLRVDFNNLLDLKERYRAENQKKDEFMRGFRVEGKTLDELYREKQKVMPEIEL